MLGQKWLEIDSIKLINYIWKRKLTEQDIANYLQISVADLYNKIYIYKYFDRKEVAMLEKLLELSKVERELIFRM